MTYADEVGADSPVAWYRLDETSGTVAADSGSGTAANGTYTGGYTLDEPGIDGANGSVFLDWANPGYVNIGAVPSKLRFTGNFSIEAWCIPSAAPGSAVVSEQFAAAEVRYTLGFYDGANTTLKPSFAWYNGEWRNATSPDEVAPDEWHHLVGTWNGTQLELFVDGVSKATQSTVGTMPGGTDDLYIGRRWDDSFNEFFGGWVDEVAFYGTALSSTRVAAHYVAGSPDASVSLSTVAAVAGVPAPGVAAGTSANVSLATVVVAAAVPAPSISAGDITNVSLSTVAAVAGVPTPTVSAEMGAAVALSTVAAVAGVGWLRVRARQDGTWRLDIQGPDGGANLVTSAPFQAARITWTVDGPGAAEVDLRPEDLTDDWQPGTHRLVVDLDNMPEFAGYLTRLTRDGPPENITYKASAIGLASILDWRLVRHLYGITGTAAEIVASLLDEAQTQYHGDMGFSMGAIDGTTVTRTRGYCFGVVIGEAIRELASIGRGFDWEVDATGALNIWNNTRGVNSGKTLAEEDTQSWSVELETSDLVTTVSVIGDQSQPFGPMHHMVRSPGMAITYGRREVVVDVDSTDSDELFDAATAELVSRGGALLRVRTMWIEGRGPWQFGDVWMQDRASVVLPAIFGGTQGMRLIEASVSLDPGTHVYVEHTFEALVEDITEGDPDEGS